ncbi:MAG: hypothetical protein JST01_26720 [Cyanobacteria bacterium SZAS TMP-1]|nr:hypothetical protein [Cyanobacteria bacterium SZAS TMP-1]
MGLLIWEVSLVRACKKAERRVPVGEILYEGSWGLMIGVFVGFLLAYMVIPFLVPTHSEVRGPATLAAMRSSDGAGSAFVWARGDASLGETEYHFFVRNADGSFTPGHIAADSRVRIIEQKDLVNVGYWTSVVEVSDLHSPWANWSIGLSHVSSMVRQEFRVPVGTVVQNFSVK